MSKIDHFWGHFLLNINDRAGAIKKVKFYTLYSYVLIDKAEFEPKFD